MVDHRHGVATEIARFHAAVRDLDLPVPSCPQWQVRHVVQHLGTVHRTFRRVAVEGWMRRPPDPDPDDRPAAEDDAVVAWAREQADKLLDAIDQLDPNAPRWNFSPGPQIGAFIPRRMHLETAIHRWDLELADGTPGTIAADIAADGVEEYLEVYLPRSGPWSGEQATVLVRPDGARSIAVTLQPGDLARVTIGRVRTADLLLQGPADQLLLALWGRQALDPLVAHDAGGLADALLAFGYR